MVNRNPFLEGRHDALQKRGYLEGVESAAALHAQAGISGYEADAASPGHVPGAPRTAMTPKF